jgi:O-antigen ligase
MVASYGIRFPDARHHVARKQRSKVEVAILATPLAVAIINPGTGFESGIYAAVLVIIYAAIRYASSARFSSVDYLTMSVALIVLISPLWAFAPLATGPASRSIVATLLYFMTVRGALRHRSDFILFISAIAWMSVIYALYFLANGKAFDLDNSRISVDFANANYTGAILAFGAVSTLWLAIFASANNGWRYVWVSAATIDTWAAFETGSRASAGGLLAALAVVLFFKNLWVVVRTATTVFLATGFVSGFIPQSDAIFKEAAQPISAYRLFAREDIDSLSGREQVWESARKTVSESPILGSGPEGYRLRGSTQILAHSWGLEYMASVGLLGTALLAVLIWFCFAARGIRKVREPGRRAWLWNSATALSLLPNLMLSTHQWTLWAWAGFALWSRSYLLDGDAEALAPNKLQADRETF